jgi:hypothetical protein
MGLSASQARFLMLTARKSNLEYEAQQIQYQRMQLADSSESWTKEYEDAMNNQIFVYSVSGSDTQYELSYSGVTNSTEDEPPGLGMLVTDANGKIVVTPEKLNTVMESFRSSLDSSLTEDEKTQAIAAERAKYTVDENVTKNDLFLKGIESGTYFITREDSDGKLNQMSPASLTRVQQIYDTSDDAAAQSTYDVQTAKLQKADKQLELELQRIETDHKAVEEEMESIKKVIDKNIEDGFKTFG